MREKSQMKGLTSNYLEQDMEDEEDFDDSLAAIKNKFKKDVKGKSKAILSVCFFMSAFSFTWHLRITR